VMCWLHQYCGLMLSFPKTVETLVAGNLQGWGLPAQGFAHCSSPQSFKIGQKYLKGLACCLYRSV
jgi:hypothetical protein